MCQLSCDELAIAASLGTSRSGLGGRTITEALWSSTPWVHRTLRQRGDQSISAGVVALSGQNSSASEVLAIRCQLLRGYENTDIFEKTSSFYSKFKI